MCHIYHVSKNISYITTETLLKLIAHVPNGKNGWQCYKHLTEWYHIWKGIFLSPKNVSNEQNAHFRKEMNMADTENYTENCFKTKNLFPPTALKQLCKM